MKVWLVSLCVVFLFSSGGRTPVEGDKKVYLKCYGYDPCSACKTCNYCQHCNSGGGGGCGVCTVGKKKEEAPKQKAPANQCKAKTKKGTRCSRSAGANGYCWQHGS